MDRLFRDKEIEQRNDNHLKLLKGKAPASPGLHVVLAGLALHDGAKRSRGRAGEDLHSLLLASCIQKEQIVR